VAPQFPMVGMNAPEEVLFTPSNGWNVERAIAVVGEDHVMLGTDFDGGPRRRGASATSATCQADRSHAGPGLERDAHPQVLWREPDAGDPPGTEKPGRRAAEQPAARRASGAPGAQNVLWWPTRPLRRRCASRNITPAGARSLPLTSAGCEPPQRRDRAGRLRQRNRRAIGEFLKARKLPPRCFYIVTTLGCHSRSGVRVGSRGTPPPVDSELSLLYQDSRGANTNSAAPCPIRSTGGGACRSTHPLFPMYLVTRLAAYDVPTAMP